MVVGSAAKAASAPKRRRVTTGLRALGKGFEALEAASAQADLQYIVDQLKGPQRDQIKNIANMLRQAPTTSPLGPRIRNRKSMKFGSLPSKFVKLVLQELCAGDELQLEALAHMSLPDSLDTLFFALNVNKDVRVPDKYPALAYEQPLLMLFSQRYQDMGTRLVGKDLSKHDWGYFSISGAKLRLSHPQLEVEHPLLKSAKDWTVEGNYTHSARLKSKSLGTYIMCIDKFKELLGTQVLDEHGDFFDMMASNKVPKIVYTECDETDGQSGGGTPAKTRASGDAAVDDGHNEDEADEEDAGDGEGEGEPAAAAFGSVGVAKTGRPRPPPGSGKVVVGST